MLKTMRDGRIWLVTQPDHGQVAGYLAAHWGNLQFLRPGYFARTPDPERLRAETIAAIEVPRRSWEDRVTIRIRPLGERRIACDPSPFDTDPLAVEVPARIFDRPSSSSFRFHSRWHSVSPQRIRFEYSSH